MSDARVAARRERVLAALVSAGQDGISGQALADSLECSRAAIHRHVEALRRDGVSIDGAHEGYVIDPNADLVVPSLVTPRLTAPVAGPVRWSAATGSTNDDVVAAARAGAPEGLVIGADFQSAGRGRRGREWHAAPGDALMFSVLLRPRVAPVDAAFLPLLVAVAVAEGIGDEAGIVWPNDIVVEGRKVCGILCESSADETGLAWAVAGIGVNVRAAPALDGARWQPGSVSGVAPTRRADLLVRILLRLSERYAEWTTNGPAAALSAYGMRDRLSGHGVTVRVGDADLAGTAAGVDDLGRLRVLTPAGEQALGAGEVVKVERSSP